MSWITQSVTGKISQISGQLKDILTESTEDVLDPNTELKATNDKLKENEKHIELLKMELTKWQEESNELNLRCKTFEAQLEQRQSEYRNQLLSKDNQINELRKQLNDAQTSKNDLIDANSGYQKSAFMEEFEELMPSSELNDYINLQKEIKRLKEENFHLTSENKELLNKLKYFRQNEEADAESLDIKPTAYGDFTLKQQDYEIKLAKFEQEIFSLRNRLQADKDKHQDEIICIQENYNLKIKSLKDENKNEIDVLKAKCDELQERLNARVVESSSAQLNSDNLTLISSSNNNNNKSDEGWCLNDSDIQIDANIEPLEKNIEKNKDELENLLAAKNNQIIDLQNQIEMFSNELEQANMLITRLKKNGSSSLDASPKSVKSDDDAQTHTLRHKIKDLEIKLEETNEKYSATKANYENMLLEINLDLKNKEKQIDSLNLELKQLQQFINEEKMLQMHDEKQEAKELKRLKDENVDLKIKLDEKQAEIKLLCDQMKDLDTNLNMLKSNDSKLMNEVQQKTEQFLLQLDAANNEIALLKDQNEKFLEQKKQFEFVLEEKTRECSQLKSDAQKHVQHLSAQSKAMEKLQNDLKELENEAKNKSNSSMEKSNETEELNLLKQQYNDMYIYLEQKNQESLNYYNEIQRLNLVISEVNAELQNAKNININLNEQYDNLVKEFQLEQNMVDDLNQQTYELNNTLMNTTSAIASQVANIKTENNDYDQEETLGTDTEVNSKEQNLITKENIKKEPINEEETNSDTEKQEPLKFENNGKIIEEMQLELSQLRHDKEELLKENEKCLNEYNFKLNETVQYYETLINTRNEIEHAHNNDKKLISEMEAELNKLKAEKDQTTNENNKIINELNMKLNETTEYYENIIKAQNEDFKQNLLNEEQQQNRLNKELERLREHLVEMSDTYTKEAIHAEDREKQLRLALNNAQQMIQQQGANIETSSKEIESKLEQVTHLNQELKNERDKLKDRLKHAEENLSHQVKVTKNLELVLERMQNDKDSQNSIEILKYQQTIKEQALNIHTLQNEIKNCQYEIQDLKDAVESATLLESQLHKKDELVNQLQAQINNKDALIESFNKKVNDIQKVNESFIEKEIIKNVIIGYIKVNQQQEKKQALKLISLMLNFTPNEIEQIEALSESKWSLSSLLSNNTKPGSATPHRLSTQVEGTTQLNKSFTELLINYVEKESKPKPNFSFDLNDPNLTQTNKKTDSPVKHDELSHTSSSLAGSSASSFGHDLTLFNRNQQQQTSSNQSNLSSNKNAISGLASPSTANNFLEQILK